MIKSTVLDVLLYLFNSYMDADIELNANDVSLHEELIDEGFSNVEIEKAFLWLDQLSDQPVSLPITTANSLRVYTENELQYINVECRGFMLFLEQVEVLNPTTRELVIDRIMALETTDINLDQFKWVILMVLFNQPGQEAALVWMEDFVFNNANGYRH